MGKTTADVMPPLTFWQQVRAMPDSLAFSALSIIFNFIVIVFFVGDVLMSARLILVGILRDHRPPAPAASRGIAGFNPRVAVLIPSYNEEKVIVRTIRSVLELRLREPARDRDRRRIEGSHRGSGARGLSRQKSAPGASRCWRSRTAARPRR